MNSYIQQLFPFVDMGDFIKNTTEVVDAQSIYCPVEFGISNTGNVVTKTQARPFNAYRIDPCGMLVVDEQDSILKDIKAGAYGDSIRLTITEMDYTNIASRIEVLDDVARVHMNQGYMTQNVLSDIFINSATNGFIITPDMIPDSTVKPAEKVSFKVWVDSMKDQVNESADAYKDLLSDMKSTGLDSSTGKKTDSVYQWLDAYFALPEGASTKARSEVPLLIGPTGVFKSSTIKELCKKYGYRLIDFRAAFTSRLDYSGLYQMGTVDDQLFSYSCPMEELVTCSDGFIEYCKRAYDKVSQILAQGYIVNDKTSNGEITEGSQTPLTDEQKTKLEGLLSKYKEYMKPVCLFVDEITRVKDSGVNGILTEMLNQKRFNNMPMKNCKFVAATNANLKSRTDQRHNDLMEELDDMYDVNDDLDIAFSNRFIPLLVRPEDVQDRWFEWATAKTKTSRDGLSKVDNIHPLIVEYLTTVGADQVYNDSPILDAIEAGLTDNETKSQPFPNYRTWEMVSNYLYTIDEEYDVAIKEAAVEKDKNDVKKVYRPQVITGLISKQSGDRFITFLKTKGYISIEESLGKEVDDEYSDFLQTSLDAGVPALMVGPSSIGKTSRVEQYIKRQKDKTGLEPVLINIDLASKDAVDLMGMPAKLSLVDYVAGKDLEDMGLGDVKAELSETVRSVQSEDIYGLSDYLTVRSPDLDAKNALLKAKREGREIIFFFDECNRVKSSTVLSSMFEVVSDARYAGLDFSDMRDKVKVIAACNMSHSEMDSSDGEEVGDYSEAGSIDPALAARFSVFWKKNYDEKDVKSWIAYMEEQKAKGTIDGTLLEFFKSLPMEKCIEIIASVEKRQLAYAKPSTRSMTQLSRDIKSMRGISGSADTKLYYGKLLFDDMTRNEFGNIYDNLGDEADVATKLIKLVDELLDGRDTWDALLAGEEITVNNRVLKAEDLLDNIEACIKDIKDILMNPITDDKRSELRDLEAFALTLLSYCNDMDDSISQRRRAFFEQYVGEEFTKDFLPYFNENFGSENDQEITIEMLSDTSLVKPFFKKLRAKSASLTEEQYEDNIIKVMKEFLDAHGTSLQPKVYSAFIDGIRNSLASNDSMDRILRNVPVELDPLFEKAEQVGDAWILDVLMSSRVSLQDVQTMRDILTNSVNTQSSNSRATLM